MASSLCKPNILFLLYIRSNNDLSMRRYHNFKFLVEHLYLKLVTDNSRKLGLTVINLVPYGTDGRVDCSQMTFVPSSMLRDTKKLG